MDNNQVKTVAMMKKFNKYLLNNKYDKACYLYNDYNFNY